MVLTPDSRPAVFIGLGDRYQLGEEIGITREGYKVHLAFDNISQDNVTVKRIPRGPDVNKYVERDTMNRRTLIHPHIIALKEVILSDFTLDVILEFAHGRDLAYYLEEFGPLSERHARHFFQQLIIAVDFCHRRKTCVRDIRLENLSLNKSLDVVKLNNFSLSKNFLEQSRAKTKVGMPDYMAPEVLKSGDEEYDGFKVDIWACGICLFALIFGYMPFSSEEDAPEDRINNLLSRIENGLYTIPTWKLGKDYVSMVEVSPDCIDIIDRLLCPDPEERITMQEILEHPWFLTRLPEGALSLNDAVDPVDDKLVSADPRVPKKSILKRILAHAAQPITRLSFRS